MPAPDPAALAARIRAERERLGLSVREAAALAGFLPSTYAALEGRPNPTIKTLAALVAAGWRLEAIVPELLAAVTPRHRPVRKT